MFGLMISDARVSSILLGVVSNYCDYVFIF